MGRPGRRVQPLAYRHFFAFVADPKNGLTTLTLPFENGLEVVVKA